MTISKEVVGWNRVKNKLRKLVVDNPMPANKIVARWLKKLATILRRKKYPPERPMQRYQRTGKLRRRWSATATAIQNTAAYARWVVNEGTQAWFHAGRWWTMQGEFEKHRPELVRELTTRYGEEWEK